MEAGANWVDGKYGYKVRKSKFQWEKWIQNGWSVPLVQSLGVEGGQHNVVSFPLTGPRAHKLNVDNGYHVSFPRFKQGSPKKKLILGIDYLSLVKVYVKILNTWLFLSQSKRKKNKWTRSPISIFLNANNLQVGSYFGINDHVGVDYKEGNVQHTFGVGVPLANTGFMTGQAVAFPGLDVWQRALGK